MIKISWGFFFFIHTEITCLIFISKKVTKVTQKKLKEYNLVSITTNQNKDPDLISISLGSFFILKPLQVKF